MRENDLKQEKEKTTPVVGAATTALPESSEKHCTHSIQSNAQKGKGGGNIPPLATVDAETLLSTPLKPIQFIIKDLLPQGIHLLAGNPKVGKSWLVLWVCSQISKGDAVWNYPVKQGTVLYLCLEDSYQRVQNRLSMITDDPRENLHFAIQSLGIENGLCLQIEQFIAAHPDTHLVVIDTFQKIRPSASDGNMYASDYQDVSRLKAVADKHGIAIWLVHHLRKKADENPYHMVSGTNALTGAVDSSFILQKSDPNGDEAVLQAQGRDIEPKEFRLRFEGQTWHMLSGDETEEKLPYVVPPLIVVVWQFIYKNGSMRGNATELVREMQLDIPPNVFTKLLNQHREHLREKGVIYAYKRSGAGGRMIQLTRIEMPLEEDSDGSDSSLPPGGNTVTTVTKQIINC